MRDAGERLGLRVALSHENQGRGDDQHQNEHDEHTDQGASFGVEHRFQAFDRSAVRREPQHPHQPECPQDHQIRLDPQEQWQDSDQVENIARRQQVTQPARQRMPIGSLAPATGVKKPDPHGQFGGKQHHGRPDQQIQPLLKRRRENATGPGDHHNHGEQNDQHDNRLAAALRDALAGNQFQRLVNCPFELGPSHLHPPSQCRPSQCRPSQCRPSQYRRSQCMASRSPEEAD